MVGSIITIVTLIALWRCFEKMGRQGWEGIIPFYNLYILFDLLYGNGLKFLLFLIPIYNIYLMFKFYIDLANSFNQSTGFGLGLVFLNPIFMCILAFKSDIIYKDGSYESKNTVNDITNKFSNNSSSQADALKKYKDLLDCGAITEEEYESKKQELLK